MVSQKLKVCMRLRKIAARLLPPASQLKRSTTDLCVYGICLLVGKFPVASAFIYVQEFYSFVTPHRISKAVFENNLKSSTVFKRHLAPAIASNVCLIENCSKHSSNTLLRLLRFFMRLTLVSCHALICI